MSYQVEHKPPQERKPHFFLSRQFLIASVIVLVVLPIVSLVEFFGPSVSTLFAYREQDVLPVVTVAKPSDKPTGADALAAILVLADPEERDILRIPVNTTGNGKVLDRKSFADAAAAASMMQPGVLHFETSAGSSGSDSENVMRLALVGKIAGFYAKHATRNAFINWSHDRDLKKQISGDQKLSASSDPKSGRLILNYAGERAWLNTSEALAMTHDYVGKLRARDGDPRALNNGFAEAALTSK